MCIWCLRNCAHFSVGCAIGMALFGLNLKYLSWCTENDTQRNMSGDSS